MARAVIFWLLWVPTTLMAQSPDQGQELFRLGRIKFSNHPSEHFFHKITDREFEYLFSKNHQNRPEAFTKAGVDGYLDLIINFKLKVLEARRRGIDTTRAFRNEFEGYRKDILKSFDPVVTNTEQLLVEAYERMKSEVHAAHILLRADPDLSDTLLVYNRCLELRQRILSGEDFNALARKFSEDPSAASNGGDLGYFTALNMVYPFENAAYSTPVGQVSMPVRTRFGYHLVKVIDVRPAEDETEVSHILVRQGEQFRTPEEAKLRVDQAAARLRSGASWDEVCKEFSDDPATKDRGGRLQPFRRGALTSVAPEFEEVALTMRKAGEISGPVPSTYGWHIIRFEGKVPMRSLKEMRMVLQQQISRDERSHYSGVKRLQRLKVELGFRENPAAFHSFMSLADSALLEGKWKFTGTSAMASSPIFTLGNREVRVDNLAAFVSQKQRPAPGQDPEQVMRKWYGSFVQQQVDLAAEERLERGNEKYRFLIKEYKEGMMLFAIMEQEVWNRAAKDTVGQRSYYNSHPGDFMAGNRIFARLLGSGDTVFMKTVRQKVERRDSLTVAELRKLRTYTGFRNFGRGDSKVTDRIEWKAGLHETVVDNIRYLVEVKALVPPGRKTLEEARAEVVSGYQDLLEVNWIAVLRKKYPVRLDEKVLSMVTDRILRNKPGS